jgi:hypothetical protein
MLDVGGWSTPRPGLFFARERNPVPILHGVVGPPPPQVQCVIVRKSRPPPTPPDVDPRTVRPAATQYTDGAIGAHVVSL